MTISLSTTLKHHAVPATLLQTDIYHHSAVAHEQQKSEVKLKYHFALSEACNNNDND